jgi:hypothetical protein
MAGGAQNWAQQPAAGDGNRQQAESIEVVQALEMLTAATACEQLQPRSVGAVGSKKVPEMPGKVVDSADCLQIDDDLAAVIDAWPKLTADARARIVKLAKARLRVSRQG